MHKLAPSTASPLICRLIDVSFSLTSPGPQIFEFLQIFQILILTLTQAGKVPAGRVENLNPVSTHDSRHSTSAVSSNTRLFSIYCGFMKLATSRASSASILTREKCVLRWNSFDYRVAPPPPGGKRTIAIVAFLAPAPLLTHATAPLRAVPAAAAATTVSPPQKVSARTIKATWRAQNATRESKRMRDGAVCLIKSQ